ncbi:sigma 54-interacting transcriptional regulator [Hyphomicrobium sp. CS1BSMeth3]|uniref:sigma-54 interaction domain-containing protein n=1 Tax=Hyphomicrobium sp. CS1BSMeth3 TaxID=1892844 RepID=UPI000AB8D81F|nr:sigma 54-interacting transcriptional regulator [Hyphomicrobium sp. CS1BSMeth3]
MANALHRRLLSINLGQTQYAVVASKLNGGSVLMLSSSPGEAVIDFLGSVDFAYDILNHLVSDRFDAMIIVDDRARIAFISPVHERFFGLGRGEATGRPVRDIIENTRLDRVVKTGRSEVGLIQHMNGIERVVSRAPIRRNGTIVGAFGRVMFKGPEQLEALSRRINDLEVQVEYYKAEAAALRDRSSYGLDALVGDSPAMERLRSEIIKVAPLEIPVLIRGESGTGKELVAHALHRLSPRRDASLVTVNAAALPATLVEAELFGYEPGAFTGADRKGRKGKFEQAAGGTIFLDEIGDMPIEMQAKLLRVLQDRMIERVGGSQPREVDFRIVTATNRDLHDSIEQGDFRLDLYYRISPITIEVPPLRNRIEDIPILADQFLNEVARRHGRPCPKIASDATAYLMDQAWPGNVRQLRHEIERAFVFAESNSISAATLARYSDAPPRSDAVGQGGQAKKTATITLKESLAKTELEMVREALVRHKGNKKRVAQQLGISRSYLYKILGELG